MRIVVIAASAGGLKPIRLIVEGLPSSSTAAVFIVLHTGAHPSRLPALLSTAAHPAVFAYDGALIEAGYIYVAPPDQHVTLRARHMHLSPGPKIHHTRPAADPLFLSAAQVFGREVMGVVLSGGDGDGANGLKVIAEQGGVALVQDPEEAEAPSMPLAAIIADHPDACLPAAEIAQRVRAFCQGW